jgi:hypothetical protein
VTLPREPAEGEHVGEKEQEVYSMTFKSFKTRDWIATILVAVVAVPYIGYLIRGEMPFLEDPRGMAGLGLVVGVAAFLVIRTGDAFDKVGKAETGLAVFSIALGVAALAFAETGVAEALLAVFMVSIVAVWAVEMMDHAGVLPMHHSGHAAR